MMAQEKAQVETKEVEKTKEVEIAHVIKVSWFDVRQLAATAAQALAATIIGPMTGRREIMAALAPIEQADEEGKPKFDEEESIWIDYMADCGDGWNASHSVAWLMGRNALHLDEDGLQPVPQTIPPNGSEDTNGAIAGTTRLEHGKIMVLGGDQVYPTASKELYQKRFVDVFRSARFWHEPFRHVFALPGNHDWYDGLTAFVRLFCQGGEGRRWVGAWRTEQHRSYFAIDLPHGWKLWALDMSLGDDLDPPQQQYFRDQARKLKDGDRVIMCLPAPIWLKAQDNPAELAKLDLIVKMAETCGDTNKDAKAKKHVTVPLILTGDYHYYARHHVDLSDNEESSTESRDYVICGGGGAFGLGTIQVPEELHIEKARENAGVAKRQAAFPTEEQSIDARRKVFKFPSLNKAFSAMLAFMGMISVWLVSVASSEKTGNSWIDVVLATKLGGSGLMETLFKAAAMIPPSVGLLLWFLALWAGFGAFGFGGKKSKDRGALSFIVGMVHGVLQTIAAFSMFWLATQLLRPFIEAQDVATNELFLFFAIASIAIVATFFALFFCGLLFGAYLFLSHKFAGMHDQEVFSAQGLEEFKAFLRMRIDKDGLTVYPVGLLNPSRNWVTAPGVQEIGLPKNRIFETVWTLKAPLKQSRLFDPKEPLEPHLIEKPFFVSAGRKAKDIKNDS